MKQSFPLKNAALLVALSAIYPLQAHAAAGIAQFAVGDVNVRRGQAESPLNRGQQINSGDQIITGRSGQTQIRFSDGGLVSLAPNTQFNIDRYADENKPEDGFFASLLRGGMRAVTGLVGKRNRDNYRISTITATIGIRGSAFSANYNPDGSLQVAGEQDGIVVCTNAGCVELIVGEAVRVTGSDQLPTRTSSRSNVPPLAAREDMFAPQNPVVIQQVPIPEPTLISGLLPGVSAMFAFGGAEIDLYPRGGMHPSDGEGDFVDGQLVRHVGSLFATPFIMEGEAQSQQIPGLKVTVEKTSAGSGSFGTVGTSSDPAFMGWGFWDTGRVTYDDSGLFLDQELTSVDQNNGVHYLVGRPTPGMQMPVTGTASYSLIGGTAPTAFDSDNSILRVGTLNSAGLNVDFGVGRLNGFINTTFSGPNGAMAVQISGYGYLVGSSFYSYGIGEGYYYGDSGLFFGFFAGDQASRAGLVYRRYDDILGTVDGAAVFLKSGAGDAFSTQDGMTASFVSDDDYVFDSFRYRGGVDPSTGTGFFVGNQLYLHDDGEGSGNYFAATSPVSSFGSIGNVADADFVGWGYWATGVDTGGSTVKGVHYLVGRPTPVAQMPSTGVATYTMVGGTNPTATNNGATITGRLLGATMNVDFQIGAANATISTDFVKNGATIPVLVQDNSITVNSGATFCGNNVSGFFTGAQATRAGMIYKKDTGTDLGVVNGAVGLARGTITPSPLLP